MAAVPAGTQRPRARRGSLERPINGRLYRGTWLLVALPLLLAAFSVRSTQPVAPPSLPPAFDRGAAAAVARDLATTHPDRVPGSTGAVGAARWFSEQLAPYGFRTETEPFERHIPGLGRVTLRNLVTIVPGRSLRKIVLLAHRDNTGTGPGAVDNASGTAALIELARAYALQPSGASGAASPKPNFTLVFLSTDGDAFGGVGAAEFAAHSRYRNDVEAVLDLDAIAGHGAPRLEFAGDTPRSPAAALLATVGSLVEQETGAQPGRPSALRQLIDLGFPFSLYGQAPFVARGLPAVTLTAGPDRPIDSYRDTANTLDVARLGQLGRAAQETLGALDQELDLGQGTSSFVFLGSRIIPGWAVELVLVAALLPFWATVVDLFARCRRRRIPIAPALRSYRSRLGFWIWAGALFWLFRFAGAWPGGVARPPAPTGPAAQHWPLVAVVGFVVLATLGWLVSRDRLIPRRPIRAEEELAGYTAALLVLCVIGMLVLATNPFALLFLLPTVHLWLWLPQVPAGRRGVRAAILLAGLIGPGLLIGSFAFRYGLGLDAFWYVADLFAIGYAPFALFAIGVVWLAAAAQLAALAANRYTPYPSANERRRRGPLRELVRRVVLAERDRRRASEQARRALEG